MVKKLPKFGQYFVDVRLRQFRKVTNLQIEFIDFNSKKGEKILSNYLESLNKESKEFKQLIRYF